MTTQNREAAVAALAHAMADAGYVDASPFEQWQLPDSDAVAQRLERRGYAIVPAAQDSDALRVAAQTVEGVLMSMDWLGTGSSQRAADAEEHEAWKAWSVILAALGDTRDPWDRYMNDENDPGPLAALHELRPQA